MNNDDIQYNLLGNLPIHIDGLGYVKIPCIRDIFSMGMSKYNTYLSTLLIDKSLFKDDTMSEQITNFDLFMSNCFHDEMYRIVAFKALELFFGKEPRLHLEENTLKILIGDEEITDSNFALIQDVITLGNNVKISKEPEYKAANKHAQKLIDMIKKNKSKAPPKKEKMDLHSIISGLIWKENGQSLDSILNMNIYQIYNGFNTTNSIENYHHTVSALYAGTIDGKKIKMSDIHWANKNTE
ncbi:hypothetical protein [Paenibacillus sp. O199]|uniref:hypothetical protein n=1 Tax=Paenibacillus sp. O199 TaxID=1643925 RepID=UPI000B208E48|nr:hypothetical protein [Paenibacillus sp. O199]